MKMALKRRIKLKLYQCLEHPKSVLQIVFHLGVFCYVLVTLCLSAVMSLDEDHGRKLDRVVFAMEAALAIYFTVEFLLRLWAVGIHHNYVGWMGRLRYCTRFISIVDILIVAASLLLLVFGSKGGHFLSGPAVQNLRFLQILRMLHVDRRLTTWRLMEKVLRLHKTELITAFYLSMLGLLVTSTIVYLTEGYYTDQGNQGAFTNYGDAIWWGVVTLFTIGYGDIVPKYWVSKLITCFFAITCISLFTLTSSIIGVGLALMVQEKSRKKHIKRQTPLAAKVIQTYWRENMISNRFDRIPFFKYTLTQRLIAHEMTPFEEERQRRRVGTFSGALMTPLAKLRSNIARTPDEQQQQQQQHGKTTSAGGSILGLIDSIKIRVGSPQHGATISSLNLSLSNKNPRQSRADTLNSASLNNDGYNREEENDDDDDDNDDDGAASTPATVSGGSGSAVSSAGRGGIRRFPRDINKLLISHVFNPALASGRLYRSASTGDDRDGKPKHKEDEHRPSEPVAARAGGGRILDKDFFVPPPSRQGAKKHQVHHPAPVAAAAQMEPEQRLRFKVSTVQSAPRSADIRIEIQEESSDDGSHRRGGGASDHSPPPTPPTISCDSAGRTEAEADPYRIPTRYVIALSAIWRMKFLVAKSKFRLARKPFDLQDITEQVSASEKHQLARLRKVQARVDRLIGPPRPSLLTPRDDRMMSLMQRLQLVEMRMAELDKKADLIVHLATHLAERVANMRRKAYNY